MNRKRTAAVLLVCLMLLCGCARADWAGEQAEALCARMTALAVDEAYVSLFTGSEEVLSQVERMAANEGLEMEQVRRFTLRSESSYADYVEWEGLELPALSAVAGEELERRLAAMPPSLLNGQAGAGVAGGRQPAHRERDLSDARSVCPLHCADGLWHGGGRDGGIHSDGRGYRHRAGCLCQRRRGGCGHGRGAASVYGR